MSITETVISRRFIAFRGNILVPAEKAFAWMSERLGRLGFTPMLLRHGDAYEVRVITAVRPQPSNPLINLLLFILTMGSTLFVGGQMMGVNIIAQPHRFAAGIPFACTILVILTVHEFGHYLMSKFHGVKASLPYFIPAPTIIGTLGAVIKIKTPIPDRKSLLDIGAAGPICGFLVALVALCVGLVHSQIVDLEPLVRRGAWEFGDSLLVGLMTFLIKGPLPEGKTVMIGPIAFAGWVGLLVTAFNLMPMGQLDGGHIIYALIGRWHSLVAKISIFALIIMGFFWQGWYVWAFLILLLGPNHPPPLNDLTPLNPGRKIIALISVALFILCLVPVPIRFPIRP